MNPNIATRASRRVPLTLSSVVTAIMATAIQMHTELETETPSSWARNGAPPTATAATVVKSAQA